MNDETNLAYFLIGYINGAQPWEAEDSDAEHALLCGSRPLANVLFPALAKNDEAFARALRVALVLDKQVVEARIRDLEGPQHDPRPAA